MIEKGSVQRAYLGVGIKPITPEMATKFGTHPGEACLVTQVQPGSPAATAGFEAGDVVTKFGDHAISGPGVLQGLVERVPVDSTQTVEILRDGKTKTLHVVTKSLPTKDCACRSWRRG